MSRVLLGILDWICHFLHAEALPSVCHRHKLGRASLASNNIVREDTVGVVLYVRGVSLQKRFPTAHPAALVLLCFWRGEMVIHFTV